MDIEGGILGGRFLFRKVLMATSSFKAIRFLVKRNLVSVLFPTLTVYSIFLDLRRTARWKQQLAQQQGH